MHTENLIIKKKGDAYLSCCQYHWYILLLLSIHYFTLIRPWFRSVFPLCPFIMKRPLLPHLFPALVLLCPDAALKAELFCLSPFSCSLPHPSLVLIFSCSARCVFTVQRPPKRAQEKCAWAGIDKRRTGKRGRRKRKKGMKAHLNFKFEACTLLLFLSLSGPRYLLSRHNKCHCSRFV